ncbi:MAG: DUF4328 domain-containing protein, partial [Acidimicrobiales bacterium]|nr:DUF4328 domain-containing protein [Acidimicrobiales bacterium]
MRCASCGAVLSGTDRYCPACDAPNTAKLFPKFRPHLTDLRDEHELPELSVAAAPGVLRCPRCTAQLRVGDAFCSVCGLDTEQVFVRAGREPWVGLWQTPGPHNLDPYRSLRPWSVTLRALLMVMMGIATALVALQVGQFDSVRTMPWRRGFGLPRTAAFAEILETILFGLALLLVLLTVGWTNRAYRNLPAMSVTGLRFSPEIAAAAWVVPGINLVIPKLILDELWKGSDPDAAPRSSAWRAQRAPVLSLVAWVVLVVGAWLAIVAGVSMPDPATVTSSDLRFAFA